MMIALDRKTKDKLIVALAVASGVVVLVPSLLAMAVSLLALAAGFF